MKNRRTSMVIVAVVLGAIASVALYRHLQGVEDQVYAAARQVDVVVVETDVPEGTTGDQAIGTALSTRKMPAEFRPATAVPDVEAIRGKVAALDLPAGTVVVEKMFVEAQQAVNTNAQRIPPGMVAISISVDQVRGVAGLIRPGDRVNMIVDDPAIPETPTKQVLFQNVDVLFVGQTPAPAPGQDAAVAPAADPAGGSSGLITLAVPPLAASKIAFVSDAGIYLTLVPPDNAPVPVPAVNGGDVLAGELTPGAPQGV